MRFFLLTALALFTLEGAPLRFKNNLDVVAAGEAPSTSDIYPLRLEVSSQREELQRLKESIRIQSDLYDELQEKLSKIPKEKPKESVDVSSLRQELKAIKEQVNKLSDLIAENDKKTNDAVELVASLDKAVKSILEALGIAPPESGKSYTVKFGDSLSEIAKKNGTTTEELRRLNNLKGDRIKAGQKLKLP